MRTAAFLIALGFGLAACEGKHDDGHKHDHGTAPAKTEPAATPPKTETPKSAKVKDVVCDMSIDKGALKADFENADFYFCSDSCQAKFKAQPTKYAKACPCASVMAGCTCGHCGGTREPCDCH